MTRILLFFSFFWIPWSFGYQVTQEWEKTVSFEVEYYGMWRSNLTNTDILYKLHADGKVDHSIYHSIHEGYFNWESQDLKNDSDSRFKVFTPPDALVDWTQFSQFHYNYQAKYNSGEVSYWRHMTAPYVDWFSFSWLLGGR